MTEQEITTNETVAAPAVEREAPRRPYHFYQNHIDLFRQSLQGEGAEAYGRWGYSMLFSLTDDEVMQQYASLGLEASDALDFYNKGCVLASQEKFEEACASFERATAAVPPVSEFYYNLALVQEKLGKSAEARKTWEALLENFPEDPERAEVEAHLGELA